MTQEQAFNIMKTGVNIFLTGSAGSGKTFLLNKYINYLKDKNISVAITASTGIAATHMNGLTIHSWSGMGIRKELNDYDLDNLLSKEYLSKRIRNTSVLIIDEVSMLEDKQFDTLDLICRQFRLNDQPFGGMQIVLSGDFFQLPPIVKNILNDNEQGFLFQEDEKNINTHMIMNSKSWIKSRFAICYLKEQFRQQDDEFIEILNSIRNNKIKEKHLKIIESRLNVDFPLGIEPTKIYTHNINVDTINHEHLSYLGGKEIILEMSSSGNSYLVEVLKKGCLAPEKLYLKVGAEVMFLKNNFEKGYVNGTRGKIDTFLNDGTPIVVIKNGVKITVEREDWIIEENGHKKASISQFPLRLAWAITIHKSQGMSLDYAEIDLSNTFTYGMGYVALSRVKSLAGIKLVGFQKKSLFTDPEVLKMDEILKKESEENRLIFSKLKKDEQIKLENDFIIRAGIKKISKKKKKTSKNLR